MIFHKKIPNIWKMGQTILPHKVGDVNDLGNWRPIILSFGIYRIIFGRTEKFMISNKNRSVRRGFISLSQKYFVPRVNGCGKHLGVANMLINRAMTTHNIFYVLALICLMLLDLFLMFNFVIIYRNLVFIPF
jgi:hypothetical protein